MITRYSDPCDLIIEFTEDRKKAKWWQSKKLAQSPRNGKTRKNFVAAFTTPKDTHSDLVQYHSPSTGNDWLLWHEFRSCGVGQFPEIRCYQACYQLTEKYMTVMVASSMGYGESHREGVTVFTDHLFMRMEERLGVDMTDRLLVIRNFVETAMGGCISLRPPRDGETCRQIVARLPASWMRGQMLEFDDDRYLVQFNTYYTDKTLTAKQRKDLKTFKRFADQFKDKNAIERYFKKNNDVNEDDNGI